MDSSDYWIYLQTEEKIFVLSHFMKIQKQWPEFIYYCGIQYKFFISEQMESWMVGKYSGYVSYKKV